MRLIVVSVMIAMIILIGCSLIDEDEQTAADEEKDHDDSSKSMEESPEEVSVELGTPTDSVQSFVRAYNAGNFLALQQILHTDFAKMVTSFAILKEKIGTDTITLEVVDESTAPPGAIPEGMPRLSVIKAKLGAGDSTTSFTLVDEGGDWLITKMVNTG